jgi:hypothetical protein
VAGKLSRALLARQRRKQHKYRVIGVRVAVQNGRPARLSLLLLQKMPLGVLALMQYANHVKLADLIQKVNHM